MKPWELTLKKLWDNENHETLIACHRGKFSSSVMENTSLAFLMAAAEGADMVEMDLDITKDGRIVGHHDKTMERIFHKPTSIRDCTLAELKALPVYNYTGAINVDPIETFDEILDALKDQTILVLDRCWHCWDEIYALLQSKRMLSQAIFKFYLEEDAPYQWAANHPDCMFIPMCRDVALYPRLLELSKSTKVPALEIIVKREEDLTFQEASFTWLASHSFKVWCNALNLGAAYIYGAGYDDLKSIREGGDAGWGELIRRGVDIIQTDFPHQVKEYLISKN